MLINRYRFMEIISRIIHALRYKRFRLLGYKNIHRSVILESNLKLDKVYPEGIYIGEHTLVASGVTILTHEHIKRDKNDKRNPWVANTCIGKKCFIGVGAVILPGVTIGDEVIVGAATVVTKDVPSNSMIVGNPGRIVRNNIRLDEKAILIDDL